jgi:hypothetical protein
MVSTSGFLSTENAVVSAVVYASADIFNHPSRAGLDFVLVHNPNCTDRLPRGFIKRGLEYWKEGEQLHWSDHDAKRDDA